MGLDVAVEFATLGEFRLVDPEPARTTTSTPSTAAPMVRRPERSGAIGVQRELLPGPATAVAQAGLFAPDDLRPPRRRPPDPPRCAERRRVGARAMEPARRPPVRQRGGAVPPAEQLCLLPQ